MMMMMMMMMTDDDDDDDKNSEAGVVMMEMILIQRSDRSGSTVRTILVKECKCSLLKKSWNNFQIFMSGTKYRVCNSVFANCL